MNQDRDPREVSDAELERRLTDYMVERRMTRRDLLERIAAVGAVAALAPILAACGISMGSGQAASAAAPPSTGPSVPPTTPPSDAPTPTPTPSAPPTPVPSPEAELIVYNWLDLHRPRCHPVVREEVQDQSQVRAVRRHRGRVRQARSGRQRLRRVISDLGRRAPVRQGGDPDQARQVAHPEHRQPRP